MARSGSVLSISGVGRWLDRGLSRLMGSPDPPTPQQSGPGSTGSAQSDSDPYLAAKRHGRNSSEQYLQSATPKASCASHPLLLRPVLCSYWQPDSILHLKARVVAILLQSGFAEWCLRTDPVCAVPVEHDISDNQYNVISTCNM